MRRSGNGANPSPSAIRKSLSTLTARLPSNNAVDVFGDSIAYATSFQSGNSTKVYAKGAIGWAQCFGRQRWTFDHSGNHGWPGRNTREALDPNQGVNGNFPVAGKSPIDIYIASKSLSSTVILDIMTNDEPNGVPIAETKTNYSTILAKLLAAGKIVICITPRPRDITASGLGMTAAQYRQHLARRDWLLAQHNPGMGIYVVDMWKHLADPTSANGAMKAGYAYDGLHTGLLGAFYGGKALAELMGDGRADGLFKFRDVMVASNLDVFNADYPRGCVNNNPMLAGGTSQATSYTLGGGSGVTNTGSKVTSGDRSDVQQCVLGGTATGNADIYDFYQTVPAANLAIGDIVRAFADVEYDGITGMSAHGLYLVDTSDYSRNAGFLVDDTQVNNQAVGTPPIIPAFSGVMRTPELTLASTTLRVAMKGRSVNTRAVSGTYRIKALSVRKRAA